MLYLPHLPLSGHLKKSVMRPCVCVSFHLAGPELYWRDMLVHLLKSKIHRAAVTASNLNYEGSLTIDPELMEKVGMLPYERILCSNMANAARFETYAIRGTPGTREIVLNGAAALLGRPGDRLTIMSFTEVEERDAGNWKPRVIVLGEKNVVVDERGI